MSRRRLLTICYSLGLASLAVSLLVAAKGSGDAKPESAEPARPASNGKRLVCLGFADTDDPIIRIYPDNFPQPTKVTKVLVAEGAAVKSGQKLLALDDRIALKKVEEATIGVEAAKQERAKAEAMFKAHLPQVNSAKSEYLSKEQDLNTKKTELVETQRLFKIGGQKNESELEAAASAVKAASFMLESARWKLKGLEDHNPRFLIDLADAGVKRAENVLEQAKLAAESYSCNAPADGKIIRSFASDAMVFGPHSREPAFWFIRDTPLIFRCEVNQEFARRVSKGQVGKLEDDADPTQVWKCKVLRVSEQYLTKRSAGGAGPDLLQVNDDRVLECITTIEVGPNELPPRYGQKLKVTLGE